MACGTESSVSATHDRAPLVDAGSEVAADAGADAGSDSGARACSGVSATYDIASVALAESICKSPDECSVCVQTVDEDGTAVQWFEIPIAHCVCPLPTVRPSRDH